MGKSCINILDDNTVNLIAAGEVVERPASVVKELVENSIDAGADSITVEIKNGGIEFIRITDNGSGIYIEDIPKAFLRHATSKIKDATDLILVSSMGFRGEALSSISSVSHVELVTKQKGNLMGFKYTVDGGEAGRIEEIGAPDGTTIIVRNLFYNTPARRKFLKSETAEGNAIYDVMQHLALSRPDISFKFIANNKVKIQTSGNNNIKDIIYRLYGRDAINEIIPIDFTDGTARVSGYLGTPANHRASRSQETYFVNRRYIQSKIISEGIEEAYKEYLMQHKFPFCVLHIDIDFDVLDVNVHPAKLEVRFHDQTTLQKFICNAVKTTLDNREMIPSFTIDKSKNQLPVFEKTPEQFETQRRTSEEADIKTGSDYESEKTHGSLFSIEFDDDTDQLISDDEVLTDEVLTDDVSDENIEGLDTSDEDVSDLQTPQEQLRGQQVSDLAKDSYIRSEYEQIVGNISQTRLFPEENRVLSKEAREKFRIIGQLFDTYWIIEYADSVYFIDQHAAHEKVNYEKIRKRMLADEVASQSINPPIVINLTGQELTALNENIDYFNKLGFECQDFGGNDIALRGIPMELYSNNPKQLFMAVLAEVMGMSSKAAPDVILDKIASMACKASVKGGDAISFEEANSLIDQLLTLDNPYHCPHGRPTIFSMNRKELEKKFGRIAE